MGSVASAQTIDEAARGVDIEEPNRLGPGVAEAVDAVSGRGDERARSREARRVADAEFDLPFEHVKRVDLGGVRVRVDALELGQEGHLERRELRKVTEDPMRAGVGAEGLGRVGLGENGIRERPSAVARRVVLVEVGVLAADVVAEAARGRVEIEQDPSRVARIAEGVHDVGRRCGEAAGNRAHRLELRAERHFDLALENVEGVRVVEMDVGLGPFLTGLVAEPGHDHVVELGEDPQRPLRPVGDGLALAGR